MSTFGPKQYLGDGVYAEIVNGFILLTADSDGRTNRIWLDHETAVAVSGYILRAQEHDFTSDIEPRDNAQPQRP